MARRAFFLGGMTLIFALAGAPASGQQNAPGRDDTTAMANCLINARSDVDDTATCVGLLIEACGGWGEGPATARADCIGREHTFWEDRMGRVYDRLLTALRDRDRQEQSRERAPLSESLLISQRAWAEWRDTACVFEGGVARTAEDSAVETVACMWDLTAQRALELEDYLIRVTSPDGPVVEEQIEPL